MWFFLSFGTAIVEAISTVFEKKVLKFISDGRLDLYITTLNALISLVILLFLGKPNIDFKILVYMFVMSVGSCVTYALVSRCMKTSSIGVISPLLLLSPVFSGLLAAMFLHEFLKPIALLGIFLILIGTYYLEIINHSRASWNFKSLMQDKTFIHILSAAFIYGVLSVFDRYLLVSKMVSPIEYLLWLQLFIGINMVWVVKIFFNVDLKKAYITKFSFGTLILLLCLSAAMFGYRFLQLCAVSIAPIMLVLVIKRFSILFSIILSGVFFHEKKLLYKIIATCVMIVGAILMVYNQ